jgi:hypothetical protein
VLHQLWKAISKTKSQHFLSITGLVILWLALVLTNVKPNSWFMGWDVMATELNPQLNLTRSMTSVWQQVQGLGLLGGLGYLAQLPHALFQLILSFVIPLQYLRYSFTFIMLLSGMISAYVLTDYILTNKKEPHWLTAATSFIAAVIYSLHLGTVQTFYVTLEPFIVMFGLFPWIVLLLFKLLQKPTRKKYFWFFILNFFFSVIGFIPPVFIVYLFFSGVIVLTNLLLRPTKESLAKSLGIAAIIIITNLYWLFPVGLFTLTQKQQYLGSQLNQLTTDEYVEKNEYYGQPTQAALLKSFYFESLDVNHFDTGRNNERIFLPWVKHYQQPVVPAIGYSIFGLFIVGCFISIVKLVQTKDIKWSLGIVGLLSFSGIAIGTLPFSFISICQLHLLLRYWERLRSTQFLLNSKREFPLCSPKKYCSSLLL